MEKWTLRRAARVITISQFSKKSVQSFYNGPVEVVYCTVDCRRFKPELDRSRVRNRYGIEDRPIVLCVGQLIPSKGIHILIEAFKLVKKEIPDAMLLILGQPVFPGYLKTLHNLADESVVFARDVSDEDLPSYYAACDIYATATMWEGFNIPLVEAQACGKPVVAFKTGPHPEIVGDGTTGFLVEEGNTAQMASRIIQLIVDNHLRGRMGAAAAEMVRRDFCQLPSTKLPI
jgi:1,2-diacylglycerol 3-alpha-glucosyltransferase